jgi:Mg2+-importing ATPase
MALDDAAPIWTRPLDEVFAETGGSRAGLSEAEARRRLRRDGPNAIAVTERRRLPTRVAKKLAEPLVAILLIAAAVAGASGDWASFAIIVVVVVASVALDVVQEARAETAAEALKRSVAVRATVRRDGTLREEAVDRLVVGDVVELAAGNLVPADGIVVEAHGLDVDEALLTGEPYAVEKRPGPSPALEPAEAFSALFSGTAVVSGSGVMLVTATGAATRFGEIAADLQRAEPPTAFERGLHGLGTLILRLTVFLVLFVLLAHLAFARPPLESFLFAVALAVGLTPELLPMVVTVTLSRGALRSEERRVGKECRRLCRSRWSPYH